MNVAEIVAVARLALDDARITDPPIRDLLVSATPEMPAWMKKTSFLPTGGIRRVEHYIWTIASNIARGAIEDAWLSLFYLAYDTFKKPGFTENRAGYSPPARAAWDAVTVRTPEALLDALAPSPRIPSPSVVLDVVGDLGVDALRERLAAPHPVERVIALRAIAKPRLEGLIPELTRAAILDGSSEVRAEAQEVARLANKKVKTKLAAAARPHVGSDGAPTCAAAIQLLQRVDAPLTSELAALLRHRSQEIRMAACGSVTQGASPEVEEGVTAILRDGDEVARATALAAAVRIGVSRVVHTDLWVEALRCIVREGPDVRLATYLLRQIGPAAKAAALDVIRALPKSDGAASGALIAFGTIPPEGRPLLEAYARDGDSTVAEAASEVLRKLADTVAVPLEKRVQRIAAELESDDAEVRRTAVFYAKELGLEGGALLPALRALGERIAQDPTRASELPSVREALVAVGCAIDDLPHPPSHFEVVASTPPREIERVGELMVGELPSTYEHGRVVRRPSRGLWDVPTGKLLFLVEDAEVLEVVPGRREVIAVRTRVPRDAPHGGPDRADADWSFERRSIPSGEVLSWLPLSGAFTYGSPSMADVRLTERGMVATVFCGDEDRSYLFQIVLGDGSQVDHLSDEVPRPWTKRMHRQVVSAKAPSTTSPTRARTSKRNEDTASDRPRPRVRKIVTAPRKPPR